MRIHVVGIGSIGTLFAAHLRSNLPPIHHVALIHKNESRARQMLIQGANIRVTSQSGTVLTATGFETDICETELPSIDAEDYLQRYRPGETRSHVIEMVDEENRLRYNAVERMNSIESLVVAVKAHATVDIFSNLKSRLSPHSTVVLLQNGMGIYEDLVHEVFRDPKARPHFILCSNTHGALLRSPGEVMHMGEGEIDFGIVPDGIKDFESSLTSSLVQQDSRALRINDITTPNSPDYNRYRSLRQTVAALSTLHGLHCNWKPMAEVNIALRRKLVVNAFVNPLTALLNCPNGDILNHSSASRIKHSICDEAEQLFIAQAAREGLATIPPELRSVALSEECRRVLTATKSNISSMLQDIRSAKKTEIKYINGYLWRQGVLHGVEMPAVKQLYDLIRLRNAIPMDPLL